MLQEKDDTILEQGSTYQEKGNVDQGQVAASEMEKDKADSRINSFITNRNMKKIIIGGLIVVVVFIVGTVCFLLMEGGMETEIENEPTVEVPLPFQYSHTEVQELRLAGYTGNEIEEFEREEIDAQVMIQDAAAERQKQYEKEILPYFNDASSKFKKLWKDTWVGQKKIKFGKDVENYSYHEIVINVDYERLPSHGYQLFIKFYIGDGEACFMNVTPERYNQLKGKGNIVLKLSYTKTDDDKKIITAIEEIVQ